MHDHSPALRRAIMRAKPEFYGWSSAEQETYGLTLGGEDDFRIRQNLLKELLQIDVGTEEALDAIDEELTGEQHLALNTALLPLRGIGDDRFWLNEYLGEKTLLDFGTLHDYDYDDYCFQEKAWSEQIPDYPASPYRGNLDRVWARLRIDGQFHYANLSMAAMHTYHAVDDAAGDLIDRLIPHNFVPTKKHGQRKGKGRLWDMKVKAGGMEPQLLELKGRSRQYLSDRCEWLKDRFDHEAAGGVYMIDITAGTDPEMLFLFTDKTALQGVRFRHFVKDCRAVLRSDAGELDRLIAQEKEKAETFLRESYDDIVKNFDPKVVKLGRTRDIVVADGALTELF